MSAVGFYLKVGTDYLKVGSAGRVKPYLSKGVLTPC